MENQRSVIVAFVLGSVIIGVFVRSFVLAVMGYAALQDPLLGGLTPASTFVGLVTAIIAFIAALRHERARTFSDSVVSELGRVTWPTREETFSNTGIVVGATIFFATLLSAYDFVWARLTGIFLYTTG